MRLFSCRWHLVILVGKVCYDLSLPLCHSLSLAISLTDRMQDMPTRDQMEAWKRILPPGDIVHYWLTMIMTRMNTERQPSLEYFGHAYNTLRFRDYLCFQGLRSIIQPWTCNDKFSVQSVWYLLSMWSLKLGKRRSYPRRP